MSHEWLIFINDSQSSFGKFSRLPDITPAYRTCFLELQPLLNTATVKNMFVRAGQYSQKIVSFHLIYANWTILNTDCRQKLMLFLHFDKYRTLGILFLIAGVNNQRKNKERKPKVKLNILSHKFSVDFCICLLTLLLLLFGQRQVLQRFIFHWWVFCFWLCLACCILRLLFSKRHSFKNDGLFLCRDISVSL